MQKINKSSLYKEAINQIILMIVDIEMYNQTDNNRNNLKERIKKCIDLTKKEISRAYSLRVDCVPDSNRMLSYGQKKLKGLESLLLIIELF